MSKISPFLEEVVYLVADFLTSIQHQKEAQKLKKQFTLPAWVEKNNPLMKKGLKKVLKEYINENAKALKYYQTRKPEQQEQESQQQQQVVKNNKKTPKSVSPRQSPRNKAVKSPKLNQKEIEVPQPKSWMASQFSQPKRLEDINNDNEPIENQVEEQKPKKVSSKQSKKKKQTSPEPSSEQQQQTPKPKKQQKVSKKQKKQKGPVDTSYLDSADDFQLQGKQAKKLQKKQQKPSTITQKTTQNHVPTTVKQSVQIEENNNLISNNNNRKQQNNESNGNKKFFSRINEEQVGFIPDNRRDNTFEAKARYGAGDSWGQFGYEKLKETRGDSFKKTKGKLKNKAFQGSGININQINSVPIC